MPTGAPVGARKDLTDRQWHVLEPCEQGRGPLAVVLTAGHRGDSPQFPAVLDRIRVARLGPGRPRTRPERHLATPTGLHYSLNSS